MALTAFPNTIRVTLGPAWTGRFGLSSGQTVDLLKGSASGPSTQWSEDGTATFNKSTNRLMLLFNNNINANTGYPSYGPTGSYGTAVIQVAVGHEGYVSPSVSAPFPTGWRQGTGPTRYQWFVKQKQYTFNGHTITHYNFKDIWQEQYSFGKYGNGFSIYT
ncbi:MAG: hypothetical protein ACYS21_04210, partial [Planctomycetota bacterium]